MISPQDIPKPGRNGLRLSRLALLLHAGISALYVFGRPAFSQTAPLSYQLRGADGACCSSGNHPNNGHDGQWGQRDFVQTDRNQRISANGAGQTGILIDVSGGHGGNGRDANQNHWGGNGGGGRIIDYILSASTVNAAGRGIDLYSAGGNGGLWGNADGPNGGYGIGGDGHQARITLDNATVMGTGFGVAVQSWGGAGTDSAIADGFSGAYTSGHGGSAGLASVILQGTSSVTARGPGPGDVSAAVGLISSGGPAGAAEHTGDFGGHSDAGRGGDASTVMFTSSAGTSVSGHGDGVYGVIARSISGNASTSNGVDTKAAAGGNAGQGSVTNGGSIRTDGNRGIGVYALTQGGNGGNGGNGSWSGGHDGGAGGSPGAISIVNTGKITTGSNGSVGAKGIVASVLGGDGGPGGASGAFGRGGDGGAGAVAGQAISITNAGVISTFGNDAAAVIANSAGGGGGLASSSNGIIAVGGGHGGTGGAGGGIAMANSGGIDTSGDNSAAVLLQSIGGGGGVGGDANSTGVIASGAIGGAGGAAGNGGLIQFSSQGRILTRAGNASGVILQSIGGGGGSGGSANAVGVGVGLNVTVATGGKGGSGGSGSTVSFTQARQGTITTMGAHSNGVLAQSRGGGGGSGGLANSRVVTIAPQLGDNPSGAVTLAVSNGGVGQGGGDGGTALVTNEGGIRTSAAQSNGVVAQSIGGGGGNGGGVLAPVKTPVIGNSLIDLQLSVRHGGQGGQGGSGGRVQAANAGTGAIATAGAGSAGSVAQSIGGGGGNGGIVQMHDAASFNDILGAPGSLAGLLEKAADWLEKGPQLAFSKAVSLSVGVTPGGNGGAGSAASAFDVRNDGASATAGDQAPGILAQSIGGGGGNAGAIDSAGASTLLSSIDALIKAAESGAQDLFTVALPQTSITHQTGGNGGAAGAGGGSASNPAIVTNTGTIATQGSGSAGIVAQSIGGGGGRRAASGQDLQAVVSAGAGSQAPEIIDKITRIVGILGTKGGSLLGSLINVRNGGVAGARGAGGAGAVAAGASASRISTQGYQAPGILAQSVGGGGGISMVDQPLFLWSQPAATVALGATGDSWQSMTTSMGGAVNVSHGGTLATGAGGSAGIMAQSVGGGGGVSTLALRNASLAAIQQNASLSITLGGDYPSNNSSGFGLAQVAGGTVSVANNIGRIATQGWFAPGILAQSGGGGGGMAAVSSSAALSGVDIRLGSAATDTGGPFSSSVNGAGGTVAVSNLGGSIATHGALSFGVLAQSVGGGGGLVTMDNGSGPASSVANITFGSSAPMAGPGGTVSVTQDVGGSIVTAGVNSHGIVAQSIGGGGGIAGLATRPGLVTLKPVSSPAQGGDGNVVSLSIAGRIVTSGSGAAGILAQSVGGGGGLAGDQSAAHYTTGLIQNAGLTGGMGNGGAVNVAIGTGGTVQTSGANAPAILAMSVGGGGVFKDGSLYQYSTPGNEPAYGGPVSVDIGYAAQVVATGANSPAVVAISNGAYGGGRAISINLGQNALVSASSASGTGILAIAPLASATITNAGVIQAQTAIDVAGAAVVNNNGTVAGDVLMGGGSLFHNNAGGALYSGARFQGDLDSAGLLNPGGPGVYTTTRITGALNHTGTYRPDLNFGGHNSDFISVTGASTFAGTVKPVLHNPVKNVWLGIGHFAAAQTSMPATASDSPLFSYALKNNGAGSLRDPLVSVDANFTPAALPLSADRARIANSLQTLWDQGKASDASTFDKFTGVQNADQYRDALNRIAHDGQFARAANQMHASYASMNRMMSCPAFVGESTILREGDCVWTRLDTNWTERKATSDDEGYRVRQSTLTLGAQREFATNWFLGGSLSYAYGKTTSAADFSGNSDTYAGGLALKYNNAPWQVSLAVHGGVEKSRMSRGTLDGTARSKPESSFLAARLRTADEFSQPSWYLRPYVDLDVNHIRQDGYSEQGAGALNLKVRGNDTTSVMASPMIELGGRKDLANGATLRSYVAGGMSFLSGGDVVTTMQLNGPGATPFTLRSGMPRTYGNLSAGLEYVTPKGVELKTEYALRGNGEYRDQSLTLRAAYRF
ncbi:autotransporter outer membrane beta-barrel domain-containing protein [Achromobacter aegrifaciens]|uniref:autotransporter outer membrane beta-barrel domain-containing protein n=1 Tax=Achromobacter aegrifaciens TaxID=1287736 RepID=UPI000F73F85E|nr:autotransporter outer membrane beta-barrel domain-containing protein [Achromobacter aegrifaciens]RSF03828.1 autotransporter outer membrane beta-barrel domain-containing protein [Achromobacter aegrifaciens]